MHVITLHLLNIRASHLQHARDTYVSQHLGKHLTQSLSEKKCRLSGVMSWTRRTEREARQVVSELTLSSHGWRGARGNRL